MIANRRLHFRRAMAMIKNTRIWPSMILLDLENANQGQIGALRFISNAM